MAECLKKIRSYNNMIIEEHDILFTTIIILLLTVKQLMRGL